MIDHMCLKEAAIGCLESIKKGFSSTYPSNEFTEGPNFCLNNEFQTKLRMKFYYFNVNKVASNQSLCALKEENIK